MGLQMDEHYATALRAALIDHVDVTMRRRRRVGLGVATGAGATLLVVGGGIAVAAGWLSLPGTDVVTSKGPAVTITHTGSATVELGPAPPGATDIELTLSCLSPGTFTFENGASVTCSDADVTSASSVSTYQLPLAPGQHSTAITTTERARWTLTATYAHVSLSEWGVNDNGLTYGVANAHGTPDLIAVVATNGQTGYAYNRDLNPPGPTSLQTSPEPTRTIRVYTSDGHTQIGVFVIGGS